MGDSDKPNPTTLRKRRGVVRASITRLATRLKDLETKVDQPTTLDLAHRMSQKLDSLDSEFKVHHYALVDIIDDDDLSSKEQETLDEHDDEIAELAIRIKKLISLCTATPDSNFRKVATRKQTRISKGVAAITEAIGSLTGSSDDVCLLHQYEEQLRDYKKDLSDIRDSLLSQDLDESDELYTLQAKLEKEMFDCSLQIKKLLLTSRRLPESTPTPDDGKGVKLPKIDVPKFDGNIVNWKTFWEQFYVSIHSRSNLSDSEKLVYLRHSLKDGSAKNVIEGLSRSGEYYAEAVESLKARYDRPRLIHQTHVRMILEAAPLKEGTGRELRRLYDTVQQHLRALKAMDYEPSGPFITSILELKLDTNTMFEWQKHSQDSTDVPHYQKLLEFVNLRAQASEASISDHKRTTRHEEHSAKKTLVAGKPIASFTASATPPSTNRCILCNVDKHPLYACSRFKALNHEQMVSTLKSHNLCLNCLQPGHFVRQCKSLHRCKVCQRPHHTLRYEGD